MNAQRAEVQYKNQSSSDKVLPFPSKDKTPKVKKVIKKKGKPSEVYPFKTQEDIKKICDHFLSKKMYLQYLLFIIDINLGRREGDTLKLTWDKFFESDGKRKTYIEVKESKTNKNKRIYINEAIWRAIDLYIDKIGIDPGGKHYKYLIAYQWTGRSKGTPLKYNSVYKAIKRAAKACEIGYNVGTHSTRKTLGYMNYQLHPNDPYKLSVTQKMYNHDSESTTMSYIGLDEEKETQYLKDLGKVCCDIMDGNITELKDKPTDLITIRHSDLRQLIELAFEEGQSANINDWKEISAKISDIMEIVQDVIV